MEKTQELENAWAWARDARSAALQRKREHLAVPCDPFEARPGLEVEFEENDRNIRALDTILSALEDAHTQARRTRVKRKAVRLRDTAAEFIFGFGLAALGTMGLAAVCITARAPGPVGQASAVVGIALSLAWAVKLARK